MHTVIDMIAIYKITNKRNLKVYVGQTRQPLEQRFLQHSKALTPLGAAMRDCQLDNFTIEVIEQCQSQKQANQREQFWIKTLNSKVPNGYNQRDGGAFGQRAKMATQKRQVFIRVQPETYEKLKIISDKNHRSVSNQLEWLMLQFISNYETQNGQISLGEVPLSKNLTIQNQQNGNNNYYGIETDFHTNITVK